VRRQPPESPYRSPFDIAWDFAVNQKTSEQVLTLHNPSVPGPLAPALVANGVTASFVMYGITITPNFVGALLAASCAQRPESPPIDNPSFDVMDDTGDFGGDPDVGSSIEGDPRGRLLRRARHQPGTSAIRSLSRTLVDCSTNLST
jgi:hypothetical protein